MPARKRESFRHGGEEQRKATALGISRTALWRYRNNIAGAPKGMTSRSPSPEIRRRIREVDEEFKKARRG